MTSPAPSERTFEGLDHAVHERLPFSIVKISHSLSTVFEGNVYNKLDQRRVLAEFEANGEKSCHETSDTLDEIVYDKDHECVEVYLALSGLDIENNSVWRRIMRLVELVSIPDSVEEISKSYFSACESLSRVTFRESSSLKVIGNGALSGCGIREIQIPDSVEELCQYSFCKCNNLSRLTFGESSSLKKIGMGSFSISGVLSIHIPDSVEELGDYSFYECKNLSRVTFGDSSSLKKIGEMAFYGSPVLEIHIPDSVEELGDQCFSRCVNLSRVTFGESSLLKVIGERAFQVSNLSCFWLPGSVNSIGEASFSECPLNFVVCDDNQFFDTFHGLLVSKDKRVCYSCIGAMEEVILPDSVEELCEACFCDCVCLLSATFGESSALKVIGKEAFRNTQMDEIHIPDGVEVLGDECFHTYYLERVTFGESSSLKLIGEEVFCRNPGLEIYAPDGVGQLVRDATCSVVWPPLRIKKL